MMTLSSFGIAQQQMKTREAAISTVTGIALAECQKDLTFILTSSKLFGCARTASNISCRDTMDLFICNVENSESLIALFSLIC